MAKFYDIDFSLEFVSKALKEKGLDACRVEIALSCKKDKMKPVLRQAIETEEDTVFSFFVEKNFINAVKDEKDYPYKNVWEELICRGKEDMIIRLLKSPKRVMTMENLTDLRVAISSKMHPFLDAFPRKSRLYKEISLLQSRMMASACYGSDVVKCIDEDKTDFVPIMIASSDHTNYFFDGLKKDKIKEKGFPVYLSEILEKKVKDVENNAISDQLKENWVSENFGTYEVLKNEPFSVSDAFVLRQRAEEDMNFFYKDEFKKSQIFYEVYDAFCHSENAPLAKLFESQHKTVVLFKDVGQRTRGQKLDDFLVLVTVSPSTLHHELIHNADENGTLSQTPFFKKMYAYVEEKMKKADVSAFFGIKNFWCFMARASKSYKKECFSSEMLPFFATFTHEFTDMSCPDFVKSSLAVVNAYATACVNKDETEKNRIIDALNKTDMPSTSKEFDRYLKSITTPVRCKHKELKKLNTIKQNLLSRTI